MAASANLPHQESGHKVKDVQQTTCCIVGGGPAGVVLAYLLARKGVPVILLEAHQDFEREFRGDSIHPSTMEIMDELGLAERLLQVPHSELQVVSVRTASGPVQMADFSRLRTRYPYFIMMPQARFLQFIVGEAQQFPTFRLVMGASASELVYDNGTVCGVHYRGEDGWHEVRALLTVGADGRFSKVRKLAGFEPIQTSPPMDIVWFHLSRKPDDPPGTGMGRFGKGHILIQIDRGDYWQMGYVIPKGGYRQLHEAGLQDLRQSIVDMMPELADRIESLTDWKQVSLLSVEADCLPRWYRPGLLLIGDAAHVMSPVGGNGINYAIQDAVVAANVLTEPLKAGKVQIGDLAKVQRKRWWPTRITQALVTMLQNRVIAGALDPNKSFTLPRFLRLPILRNLPTRLVGFGITRVHIEQ
jgi:2-polyprenyl-6-methoxyphenol hydroxylase-like FAD-dependent oxidoreductase